MIVLHLLMIGFCAWQASLFVHGSHPWLAVSFGFFAGANAIQAWHRILRSLT